MLIFKSMISFGCNKEDMARKMLQCHLLEGHSRSPLVLVPQQQLTVFLFAGKNIRVRTKWLYPILLSLNKPEVSSGKKIL